MQGNQYQRRRRMDRLAARREAEEAYAAQLEQQDLTQDVSAEAETAADPQADAAQQQYARPHAPMDQVQRWPVVEDDPAAGQGAQAPRRPKKPAAEAKPQGQPETRQVRSGRSEDASRREKPRRGRPAWQQASDWTDQIRVVNYDDGEQPEEPQVHRTVEQLAVDRVVRLAGTIAGMCSLFALFLLFAERSSRALRHYSVQSVALAALNLIAGVLAAVVIWVTGAIPVLGFVIKLACLLAYCGAAAALLVLRVCLMGCAWGGYRWDVPVIGGWLQRFVQH